jgi:calcineurin-like phosphoesterase family protein
MAENSTGSAPLRFGLCADIHKDIMHDADERLQIFIEHMKKEKVDFILQLGDFCRPYDHNLPFLGLWESFAGPRYHVLGNHDTDGGFSREEVGKYWSMPERFYSFDAGDHHFIVLDGNDEREGRPSGYPCFMAADQLQWLRQDLGTTRRPTVVFSHQSLQDMQAPEQGIDNGAEVRALLEQANAEGGRVLACFSGHNHVDAHSAINGIDYIQINSMSNYWLGDDYQEIRYDASVDRDFPWIKYTAPYTEPLYALVTLESDGTLAIEGKQSSFFGSTPWELGYPHQHCRDRIVPQIRDLKLSFGTGRGQSA